MLSVIWRMLAACLPAIGSLQAQGTVCAGLLAMIVISACTSDGVLSMRRPSVDVGAQTAAIVQPLADPQTIAPADSYPQPDMAVANQTMEVTAPAGDMPPSEPSDDYLLTQPDMGDQTVAVSDPAAGSEMPAQSDPLTDMDVGEQPVAVLAPPAPQIPAPSDLDEQIPLEPEVQTAAVIAPPSRPHLQPRSDVHAAAYPRLDAPRVSRPAAMPRDEVACRRQLRRLGVTYRDLAPINDGGACRIDYPVKVSQLSGGIKMMPAATLSCEMAASFALWTKRELAPSARFRYLSGVKAIHQGSSYSCRNIRGTHTSSEHSRGNALDVMRIELNNGRDIDVRKPGWFAFRKRGFLNSVRADGCNYFTTVLGPGYNFDHRNHFHFDIKPRRNGRRACH